MLTDDNTNFEAMPVRANLIPSLQKPVQQVLWIGCSDSCFEETKILDLLPDEMLVHRNLGNMLIEGDMSSEVTIKHAVSTLKVKHIVVCGHYGCGIVRSEARQGLSGPCQLNALHSTFNNSVNHLSAYHRDRAFVEMNIFAQLHSLRKFPEVHNATKTRGLQLHGIVYDTNTGRAFRLADGDHL
ncbi:carbonic anhydrase [Penicillium cosmopolitanum]|uniref:Carbonic anhydrase n=1 Tax=Penicillium cosmopolitanum TaxID=1131564 RepID=A0A9W9SER3_9EURO|nr:carbonic anhydrase [Penicillium cosmopolitanum]KAJ5377060.1 carbonic anhydrase [Penicillium cosmopolitanum]